MDACGIACSAGSGSWPEVNVLTTGEDTPPRGLAGPFPG